MSGVAVKLGTMALRRILRPTYSGARHVVYTLIFDRNDIAIIMRSLHRHGVVTIILMAYALDARAAQKCILFHTGQNRRVREMSENIFCAFIESGENGDLLTEFPLKLLFWELLRCG